MQRVVLDTNIVLSAMLTNFGPAAVVLGLALGRRLALAIDKQILDEYDEVLSRPRFGIAARDRMIILDRIRRVGQVHASQALPGAPRRSQVAGKASPIRLMWRSLNWHWGLGSML